MLWVELLLADFSLSPGATGDGFPSGLYCTDQHLQRNSTLLLNVQAVSKTVIHEVHAVTSAGET
jgi:hypothetical protein